MTATFEPLLRDDFIDDGTLDLLVSVVDVAAGHDDPNVATRLVHDLIHSIGNTYGAFPLVWKLACQAHEWLALAKAPFEVSTRLYRLFPVGQDWTFAIKPDHGYPQDIAQDCRVALQTIVSYESVLRDMVADTDAKPALADAVDDEDWPAGTRAQMQAWRAAAPKTCNEISALVWVARSIGLAVVHQLDTAAKRLDKAPVDAPENESIEPVEDQPVQPSKEDQ